ncbi:DUF2489 domain-containing protein [Alteromonas sp. MB-3u-76]|jgi:hypothetical protein|uniref:DUF2489 domain-containing protein n=1 Tax=Alteromonas sp. MB-3u-76 TaxID=2058133 RepID=UPI000C307F86|nr:DUF2489 domain-containing protein [Alteromonas sp. MB-3u-76]AUC86772.1 DUF2489 domain-containing protein [Alteromonas sp. MB-3u-76]
MLWVVLTGVALVVILGLGFYAGRLLFLLKQQKKRKNDATNARIANITESIILISKAMEQQQCDLSEGVIRIVNLLNALPLNNPPDFKAKFPHTHALFVAISGFAVLEARQQLSKQERRKQDKAREQIESEYESKVLDELPGVKTFCEALV